MEDFWETITLPELQYGADNDIIAQAYFYTIHKWLGELVASLIEQDADHTQECIDRIEELTERGFKYFYDGIDSDKNYKKD